jgi:hypothetical protein
VSLRAYDVFQAAEDLGEPVWPDETFQQLIDIAFRDKYINRPDHPILRLLRGQK